MGTLGGGRGLSIRNLISVGLCWCTAALCGCAYTGSVRNYLRNDFKVGPNYRKPVAAVEDEWIDADDEQILSECPRRNDWWAVFDDTLLTGLVNSTYQQNLTLQEAGLRVLESRVQLGIAIGSVFPQEQQVTGDYTHVQLSKTSVDSFPILALGIPRSFNNWSTGFDAAWELDVWGKFRREIESADASLQATVEQYDDILVTLLAETAAAYVELRTAQERLRLAERNVEAEIGLLEIAKAHYESGQTDNLDYYQAKTNVANTEALIPQFKELQRKAELRLCVLMGSPPRDLTPELGEGPVPTAPSTVALGIPADLLRRRPDVRKAERDVAAQSAQIGVAAADLLPQLAIKGSIGYDARRFNDLFNSSSQTGLIAPTFSWDVLNYGRLKNGVLLQDARFQQKAVKYRQTVLEANADVERAVVSFLEGQQKVKKLAEAVEANKMALKIVTDQYISGEINYNQIFTLQSYLVQEEDALAVAQGDVALSLIRIYKALGGGWQIRCGYGAEAIVEPQVNILPPTETPSDAPTEIVNPVYLLPTPNLPPEADSAETP